MQCFLQKNASVSYKSAMFLTKKYSVSYKKVSTFLIKKRNVFESRYTSVLTQGGLCRQPCWTLLNSGCHCVCVCVCVCVFVCVWVWVCACPYVSQHQAKFTVKKNIRPGFFVSLFFGLSVEIFELENQGFEIILIGKIFSHSPNFSLGLFLSSFFTNKVFYNMYTYSDFVELFWFRKGPCFESGYWMVKRYIGLS